MDVRWFCVRKRKKTDLENRLAYAQNCLALGPMGLYSHQLWWMVSLNCGFFVCLLLWWYFVDDFELGLKCIWIYAWFLTTPTTSTTYTRSQNCTNMVVGEHGIQIWWSLLSFDVFLPTSAHPFSFLEECFVQLYLNVSCWKGCRMYSWNSRCGVTWQCACPHQRNGTRLEKVCFSLHLYLLNIDVWG